MAIQIKSFDTIKTNKMFRKIPASDLKIKVSSGNYLDKKEGDVIFQSGDPGDSIYLILSGDVKMKIPSLAGPRIERRSANEFMGEIEFFEGTSRVSSAVAETNCVIYPLSRKEVNDLITKNRAVLNNLQNIEEGEEYIPTPINISEPETIEKTYDEPEVKPDFAEQAIPEAGFADTTGNDPFAMQPQFDQHDDDSFFSSERNTFALDEFESKLKDVHESWNPTEEELHDVENTDFNDDNINIDDLHKEFSLMNEMASPELTLEKEKEHISAVEVNAQPEIEQEIETNFNFANFKNLDAESKDGAQTDSVYQPEEEILSEENGPDFSSWDFSGTVSDDEKNEIDRLVEKETPDKFSPLQEELEAATHSDFSGFDEMKEIEDFEVPKDITEKLEKGLAEEEFSEVARIIPEGSVLPVTKVEAPPPPASMPAAKNGLSADQLHLIIQAAERVNSNIKLDDVLNSIVETASELTQADRGTLYIIDEEGNELWSKILQGLESKEIRLKIGQGLAGSAAETNQIINIPDASKDERFNSGFDMATGYTTKSVLCFPIKNKDGKAIGVLQLINSKNGKFSELDEQFLEALSINAAIALENAELVEQLLRTDRLTSLGKMAGFILQDIKKPIITIKHFAEHIKKKQVPPDIKQVLDMLIEQASSVVNLVQTTLSYSEGKSILQSQVQSLNQVLDNILLMLAEFVESQKVKLFKKYDKDVLVSLDRNEFYQACYQITKNACEAMPNGGNLYFATQVVEGAIEISIRDTGLGIPDSITDRIFEPFMSHGKKQGTGLGLSITEKIIKDHHGTITVDSNLGEGTTFIISLPIARRL